MKDRPVPSTCTLCDICNQFNVAASSSSGGDAFARNVTESWMDGRMTNRLWYEIIISFFL